MTGFSKHYVASNAINVQGGKNEPTLDQEGDLTEERARFLADLRGITK
jgi:hypothetical protein